MQIEIKETSILKKELAFLLQYIQERCTTEYMQEWQEYFITVIYLLTSTKFREEITKIRNKYQIPIEWYTSDIDTTIIFYDWCYKQKSNPPDDPKNPEIDAICRSCNVNPIVMRTFVFDYLYFGVVCPKKSPDEYHVDSNSEFRYKCRIEAFIDNGNVNTIETRGSYGYIRFYKDTKIPDIYNFIKANEKTINKIKESLDRYPSYIRTNRYNKTVKKKDGTKFTHKVFKRDIQVYILHLLRQLYSKEERIKKNLVQQQDVADRLYTDNIYYGEDLRKIKKNFQKIYAENLPDTYTVDDNKIPKIVRDIDLQLQRFLE